MSVDIARCIMRGAEVFASVGDLKQHFSTLLMDFNEEFPAHVAEQVGLSDDGTLPLTARAVQGGVKQGILGVLEYLDSIESQAEGSQKHG